MVEALLGTLSVVLVGLIARRIWSPRVAFAAMVIAAVAPPLVIMSTTLISEAVFVPLVLGAVAAALQTGRSAHPLRWTIFTGVLLGLAELTRTNAAVLIPVLAYAVWRAGPGVRPPGRAWLRPAVLVAAAVLTVAPWTLRNWLVMHSFIPVSTEIGYTLAGTYDLASRAEQHWPAVWKEAEHGDSSEYSPIVFNASIHRWGEVKLGNELLAAAERDIRHDPAYMLKVVAWNAIRMFHLGELDFSVDNLRDTDIPRAPAIMEIGGFYVLGVLALGGLLTAAVRRAPLWLWFVPVLLLSTLLVTSFIRFRAAIDPFLVLLAALGVVALHDRFATRRRQRGVPAPEHDPVAGARA